MRGGAGLGHPRRPAGGLVCVKLGGRARGGRGGQVDEVRGVRQGGVRLALHEIGFAWAAQRIGAAMAPALIDQRVATGGARQGIGEMLPLSDTAQPLMQKDDGQAKARALAVRNGAHQMAVGAHFQHRRIIGFQFLRTGSNADYKPLGQNDKRRRYTM